MTNDRRSHLISLLVLGIACPIVLGDEPNDVNEPLRFQVVSTRLSMPRPLRGRPVDLQPNYAVALAPQGSTEFFAWPRSHRVDAFLSIARADENLSLQQKEFLEDTEGLLKSADRSDTLLWRNDPNHRQVLLYAMTLPDAKRMAQLYVQHAQTEHKRVLDDCQNAVSLRSRQIAEAEKRIPEMERSIETTRRSLEEIKSNTPYRSEQEALEAIGELDRMLSTAQVEMAGIRAKIEAIQAYQQEKQQVEGVAAKLELMFVEEAVAMQGAKAKNQMAMELRAQAGRFIDLSQSLKTTEDEKSTLARDLGDWRELLPRLRERLAEVRDWEPKIRDNKAFIYTVEYRAP